MQMLAFRFIVLDRVLDQILDDQPNRAAVRHDRQVLWQLGLDTQPARFGQRAQIVADALQQLAEIKFLMLQVDPPSVGPREQEKVFRNRSEMVNLLEQAFGTLPLFFGRVGVGQDFLNARAQNRDRGF